jgi:cell shape-determining protein MreD
MIYFFLSLLIFATFFEGTMTTLPLVFLCIVILTILMRNLFLFILAFLSGIFLDAFALRPIGETSIFLLLFVFLILLYQRKYEINTYPFVLIVSFAGALLYLVLFGYQHVFWESIMSALFAVLLFGMFRYALRLQVKNQN